MNIFADWRENKYNIKSRIVLVSFRICNHACYNWFSFSILLPNLIIHRVLIEWILGIELPYKTKIGKGLVIHHGHALVVNDGAIIGENCTLRHCTTIGNKVCENGTFSRCPIIGNNVDIGSNVCIIGPVSIGNNVTVGAGSVIVKDVPDFAIVAGNPAKIIKFKIENRKLDLV